MTAQRTMRQLLQEVEFNAQTGTYTYPKGYTQSMDALKQRLNTVRGVDPKRVEALKAYQVLAVVYYDAEGKPQVMWLLEQNGVGVNDPKLKKYLDKAGKYLDPSDYQIITNEDLNKKITESWKTGTYYMDGTQYTGMAGGTLRASAYVESVKGTLDESGLMDVVMGLGLSTAAIRGSMTYGKTGGADPILTISNRYPNEAQLGKSYNFTIKNGNIKGLNGIETVDFIIDINGNLKLGSGHSFLANGESVQAAGKLKINGTTGQIRRITNWSGHYTPSPDQAILSPNALRGVGLNVNNSWLEIYDINLTSSGYVNLAEVNLVSSIKLKIK